MRIVILALTLCFGAAQRACRTRARIDRSLPLREHELAGSKTEAAHLASGGRIHATSLMRRDDFPSVAALPDRSARATVSPSIRAYRASHIIWREGGREARVEAHIAATGATPPRAIAPSVSVDGRDGTCPLRRAGDPRAHDHHAAEHVLGAPDSDMDDSARRHRPLRRPSAHRRIRDERRNI